MLHIVILLNIFNDSKLVALANLMDIARYFNGGWEYDVTKEVVGYIVPYNFPLNTRKGFRTIYYLMKLSNHDMTTVIKDIIAVRHASINFILNVCDKLEKENDYMLTSLRGG